MSSTVESASALEISCARPGCHWKGSPADAPGHNCPTPAANTAPAPANGPTPAGPFAGMLDVDGLPVADESADRSLPVWIVWTDADEIRIIGTRASIEEAASFVSSLEKPKRGEITLQEHERGEILAEAAEEADPETQEEIEAWLVEHGRYSDEGVPLDEKTARLDARLEPPTEDEATTDPEPELEPERGADDSPQAEAETAEPVEPVEAEEPRPLATVIAEALERQPEVAAYRWLVVWTPEDETREAELMGRGKTKKDAQEIAGDIVRRGTLKGLVSVFKTQAILEDAAEIERKRELVTDPDTEVEATPEPEPEPAETEQDDDASSDVEKAEAPAGPALFDRSQYDREDLQIAKVDGQSIDRIAVAFSGEIMLDRSDKADVALYNRLSLNKDVELRVAGRVNGTGARGATNREGDLDVIVGKKTFKVETVWVLSPEDLRDD
jgi:hypothetical protein